MPRPSTDAPPRVRLRWASGSLPVAWPEQQLQAVLGPGARLLHLCRRCGSSEHGQPRAWCDGAEAPVGVSLSRSAGRTVLAVGWGVAVGVDVEGLDATGFAASDGFAGVALARGERAPTVRARTALWTRKESLLKALGVGLAVDPRTVRLGPPDEPPYVVACPALEGRTAWMTELDLGEAHVGCLTTIGVGPPQVLLSGGEGEAPPPAARP